MSFRSRPIFDARNTCIASAMPTSAIISAAEIFLTSAADLISRSGKKIPGAGFDTDAEFFQFGCQSQRKIFRHGDAADFSFTQDLLNNVGEARRFDAVAPEFLLVLAQRKDVAMRRLRAGAVNFQIAHHDERASAGFEIDERVGHEHADGVKHVRVAFAVRDDEQGFLQSVFKCG